MVPVSADHLRRHIVRAKDLNDYAQVTNALDPILRIARETGAHVLLVHHAKKGSLGWGGDTILGSTAILGSVDSALILKRRENYRTLESIQRYGPDLEETVVELDAATRTPRPAGTRKELDESAMAGAILGFLREQAEPLTEPEVNAAVEGKNTVKRRALRSLVEKERVERDGEGKRGRPYRYSIPHPKEEDRNEAEKPARKGSDVSRTLVPPISGVQENRNDSSLVSKRQETEKACTRVFPGFLSPGTGRVRENESDSDAPEASDWGEL